MSRWQKPGLLLTVFLTGAAVLIVEVVAVRILSPYFGNTIYTVSSVLSVILAALSVGYALGGRLADRHPAVPWFAGVIVTGGLSVLLLHRLQLLLLPTIGYQLSIVSGPLLVSLLFFLLPCCLLGMLSPYAIRLAHQFVPTAGLGRLSGEVFFWSTLGSIAGSLAAGFVLIPRVGLNAILLGTGLGLTLLGLLPLVARREQRGGAMWYVVLTAAVTGLGLVAVPPTAADVRFLRDGVYERVAIRDRTVDGRPTRLLQQDASVGGRMLLESDELAVEYTKYHRLSQLVRPDLQRALAIGGGPYSVPKALLRVNPEVRVDVAEIDPLLYDLARRFFRLPDDPRLQNHVTDGRRFLHDTDTRYDLIFSDVYYSLFSIPAHFTTEEFFRLSYDRLADDGVFMANVIGHVGAEPPSVLGSIARTFRSVFPNSYVFAVDGPSTPERQNFMLVGIRGDRPLDLDRLAAQPDADPFFRGLTDHFVDWDALDFDRELILRDDYAPVESLTARELRGT